MLIRPASESDLSQVAAIYGEQVRTGISTFDVVEPPDATWAAKIRSRASGDHFLVAEEAGTVIGFAYSSTYRPRPAYDHTRETSVYLTPQARGHGTGHALYGDLLARLRADDVHLALAVIALPNDASLALHRACGFVEAGLLPEVGYKFGRWIDTALYRLSLSQEQL